MTKRHWAWIAAVLAAVAWSGCGQRIEEESAGKIGKTPAADAADAKTGESKTAGDEKTSAEAAREAGGREKGDSPVLAQAKTGTVPNDGPGPLITVRCDARGSSAEEVESQVAMPLETSLAKLKDLRSLRSLAHEGRATLWVEFVARTDANMAAVAVRDALAAALRELPKDVDLPIILRDIYRNGFTILALSASRERSPAEVGTLADEFVQRRLETVPGVGSVAILGGSAPRCWIEASPERLAAYGLTLDEVTQAVEKAMAAVEGGKPAAESLATVDDVGRLVVATRKDAPVRLRDVARVALSVREAPGDAPPLKLPPDVRGTAVFLAVAPQPDADHARLRRDLDRAIGEIGNSLPEGVKLDRSVPAELAPVLPQLLERMQEDLPPGLRLQAETSAKWGTLLVPESPAPLVIKVQGGDLEGLYQTALQLAADLRKVPGIADVAVAPPSMPKPRLDFKIDRERAAAVGVAAADVARTIRTAVAGQVVGRLHAAGDRRVDIEVVCEGRTPEDLTNLLVPTAGGQTVRLADVTKIEAAAAAPAAIYSEGAMRTVLLLCRVKGRDRNDVAADVRRTIDAPDGSLPKLPAGCTIRFEP